MWNVHLNGIHMCFEQSDYKAFWSLFTSVFRMSPLKFDLPKSFSIGLGGATLALLYTTGHLFGLVEPI